MNTATLSPPPRPPRNGNILSDVGDPGGDGKPGGPAGGRRWCRMGAKLLVAILFVIAAGQLAFIVFQTVRLWLFG